VSLRTRLALAAAAAVAAAVVLASVIVYFVVRNELSGQVNRNLGAQAGRIAQVGFFRFAETSQPKVFVLGTGPQFRFGDNYFQLVDSNGNVYRPDDPRLASITLPATQHAEQVAARTKAQFYSESNISGQHVRILTMPLSRGPAIPGQPATPQLAVQVVSSLASLDHELSKIKLWLILVAIGGTGLAAGAGFLVARSALRPVRRLRDTAEHVRTTQDLTQRIEVTGNDELSQLAMTFNAMLASLDDAAQRQRQLVQDASHELRTPLTSLRTNIEVLASNEAIPDEDRTQLLTDLVAQLSEMTALIGELTELARGEEQQPGLEEVRLDLVTEDAIRRTARNHPDVPIDAELAPTTTVGTPATLERAIANLLDNAAKWSPAGSHIDVRLHDGELSVRDRGPGISDTDLPHIFERFYRATSARSMPGSGLGLAIVKQVAEAHGGTVVAERAPEGGTIMRFTIGNGNGAGGTGKS
jgi:two-component system, OmpR family, sensor histidine kinase MprB